MINKNVTMIEPGDDGTADDESDGKAVHHLEEGRVLNPTDVRRRGRTCRRTSMTEYKFRATRRDSQVKLA